MGIIIGITYTESRVIMATSQSQKEAQRKYDREQTKLVSVKYNKSDMADYLALKEYLDKSGTSANGLIKTLIKQHLADAQNKEIRADYVFKKQNQSEKIYPYGSIGEEWIEFLVEKIGQKGTDSLLKQYYSQLDEELSDIIEDVGNNVDEWIESVQGQFEDGEYEGLSQEEIIEKLKKDMYENLRVY